MINASEHEQRELWDQSYALQSAANLWGDPPVPYVEQACEAWQGTVGPILELPCGDGRNTVSLAQRVSALAAADSSARAIDIALSRVRDLQLSNCVFVQADAFSLPFSEGQFAGVFYWDLLGHLRRPEAALAEALRVCQPNGIVVGNVFAPGDSTKGDNQEQIGAEEYVFDGRFYFRYYERESITRLLEDLPAGVERVERTSWAEPPHQGYREYAHDHESWAFILRKEPNG
jgi:ubiquinone/menaquinone biosynthesis C-methylase UbiE